MFDNFSIKLSSTELEQINKKMKESIEGLVMYKKKLGQVFTPKKIVCNMLDLVGYSINNDLSSIKIIDNSCSDGTFLKEIIIRIIKKYNLSAKEIIEKNVFGIELDSLAYKKSIQNLNQICNKNGIQNVSEIFKTQTH